MGRPIAYQDMQLRLSVGLILVVRLLQSATDYWKAVNAEACSEGSRR